MNESYIPPPMQPDPERPYQAKLAISKAASELGREIDQFPDRLSYRTGDVIWGVKGEWVCEISLRMAK